MSFLPQKLTFILHKNWAQALWGFFQTWSRSGGKWLTSEFRCEPTIVTVPLSISSVCIRRTTQSTSQALHSMLFPARAT